MNVADAARAVVREYPGGAEALSVRLGMKPAVLCSKVNPNTATHHLRLDEAAAITEITGDLRILHAFARQANQLVVPIVAPESSCDMSVLEKVALVMAKGGDFGQAIFGSLADGKVSQAEIREIEAAADCFCRTIRTAVERLKGMAEPDRPRG